MAARRSAGAGSQVANRAASVATEMVRTQDAEGMSPGPAAIASPSRRPRLDTTTRFAPTCCRMPWITSAPPTMVSARSGFSPGTWARRFIVRGTEILDQRGQLPLLQEVAVQERQGIVGTLHVHLGEVPHRAADPHQVLAAAQLRDAGVGERARDELAQRLQLVGLGRVRPQEPVAHAEGTELHGPRAFEPPVAEAHQLHAAAADVHGESAGDGQVVHGSEEPQARLVIAVDDLERHAQAVRAIDELGTVRRIAHGGRGHRDHPRRAGALRHGQEVPERLQGPFDGVGAEPVRIAEVACQPERRARVLDDVEVLAVAKTEHDHPPGVRADVHDRERPVVGSELRDRAHGTGCLHME